MKRAPLRRTTAIAHTEIRPKTCCVCGREFIPFRPLAVVCGPVCARKKVDADAKAERAETKRRKEALLPVRHWLNKAQAVANKYARVRDAADGCISCAKPATWGGQWHGSHFRSVGAASAVRLNLWNIHKACSECNHHKSGNIGNYFPRLVAKIGQERVDWLMSQNAIRRYSVEYLQRYIAVIGKRLRRMEKAMKEEA